MKKLYLFVTIIAVLFASCEKKGHIDVHTLDYYIKNCTPPYEVQFYFDLTYQPKEATITWDFGDGTTSNEKQPVHLYQQPGTYNVKLTVVNYKTVLEKSLVIDVSKNPMPLNPDFGYEVTTGNNYAPCEMKFYNKTQYSSDFFWNFGDGRGSTDDSPTHIFDSSGVFNITLNAMCSGDTASSVLQYTILPPPSKISIDVVSIWLPEMYLGRAYNLYYYFNNFNENPSDLDVIQVNTYPFEWYISKDLFYFSGDYNSNDNLYFEVWEVNDNQAPVYSFGIRFNEIKEKFYPDTLVWDNGSGFAAEVQVSYHD